MNNKYQEALDKRRFFNQRAGRELWNDKPREIQNLDIKNAEKDFDTLQELIDNYSKIKKFDRAIFFNANGLVVNGVSYEQLEKALDKACEELANADKLLNKYTKGEYISKDEWKEHLLKKKETRMERYRKRREECTKTY